MSLSAVDAGAVAVAITVTELLLRTSWGHLHPAAALGWCVHLDAPEKHLRTVWCQSHLSWSNSCTPPALSDGSQAWQNHI